MRTGMAFAALLALAACSGGSSGSTSGGSTTGGTTTGSSGSTTGGACQLVGQWTGTYTCSFLDGDTYVWDLNAGGTAVGRIENGGTVVDTVGQSWTYDGGVMSIVDTSDSNGPVTCSSAGTYNVEFDPSCNGFDMVVIADPCASRGSCVPGLHVTRTDGGL